MVVKPSFSTSLILKSRFDTTRISPDNPISPQKTVFSSKTLLKYIETNAAATAKSAEGS